MLAQALNHIRKRAGKRMRPMLILLMAKNFGRVTEVTQNAAIGLELLHTASLVHDDVVDESGERRGQASVNAIYDNKVSVLVGDYILSTALLHVSYTHSEKIVRYLAQLGRTLPCDLQAAPKGKLARLLGRDGFSSEDPEFDKRFSVQCGDPAAAQALLSPQVMDQLLHLGKVYLSVKADGRVFAAIQTDEPLFDAGKGRADQMKERFAGQLRDFTDLLDAMRG